MPNLVLPISLLLLAFAILFGVSPNITVIVLLIRTMIIIGIIDGDADWDCDVDKEGWYATMFIVNFADVFLVLVGFSKRTVAAFVLWFRSGDEQSLI